MIEKIARRLSLKDSPQIGADCILQIIADKKIELKIIKKESAGRK